MRFARLDVPKLTSISLLDNTNSFYYCGKVRVIQSAIQTIETLYSGPFSLASLHIHDCISLVNR